MTGLIKGVPPEVWLLIAFGFFAICGLGLFFVDVFARKLSPAEHWALVMKEAYDGAKEVQSRCCSPSFTNKSYSVIDEGTAIEFYPCRLVSHNPNDVQHRYCAGCNQIVSREI